MSVARIERFAGYPQPLHGRAGGLSQWTQLSGYPRRRRHWDRWHSSAFLSPCIVPLGPLLSYALRTILVSGRRQQGFALPTEDEIEMVQNTGGRTWDLLHENMLEYSQYRGISMKASRSSDE
jgi:hypothetical protein